MKWLRKHMKQIMVVVVLFAMFSFVGGSALQGIARRNQGPDAFAMAFGQELSSYDHLMAQRDTRVLELLGLLWKYDGDRGGMTVDHWHLLAEEAARAGILVSDAEVDEAIKTRQQSLVAQNYPPDYLDRLRTRPGKFTPLDIQRAIRRHLLIQKNFGRVRDASRPSDAELRHYVHQTGDKLNVRFVAVDAQKIVDESEPITEEQFSAQFEACKDLDAEESDTGFGYRYPGRVKVQYIHAPVQKIESQIEVTFEEVKTHWKKTKETYTKFEYVDPPETTTGPATTTKPAIEPKQVRRKVRKTFSEAKADVERDIRRKKATQLAEQAMRKAARELMKPWESVKADRETGYKPTPPGVDDPEHMRSVSDRISGEFNVLLDYGESNLSTERELNSVPGFRAVTAQNVDGEAISAATYAFRVPTFVEKAIGRDADLYLQLYQAPDTPLRAAGYEVIGGRLQNSISYMLFRVIEARPSEPPASPADVRADIERDIRLQRAFESAEPMAKEFYAVAALIGVDAASELFEEPRTQGHLTSVFTPPAFPCRKSLESARGQTQYLEALRSGESPLVAPNLPYVGTSTEFVDTCFDMSEEGWESPPAATGQTERTQAASTQPAAMPTPIVHLMSIPKLHKWFVIELVDKEGVDKERFETVLRDESFNTLLRERVITLWAGWFNPKHIEERCGFEWIQTAPPAGASEGIESSEQPKPQPIGL